MDMNNKLINNMYKGSGISVQKELGRKPNIRCWTIVFRELPIMPLL